MLSHSHHLLLLFYLCSPLLSSLFHSSLIPLSPCPLLPIPLSLSIPLSHPSLIPLFHPLPLPLFPSIPQFYPSPLLYLFPTPLSPVYSSIPSPLLPSLYSSLHCSIFSLSPSILSFLSLSLSPSLSFLLSSLPFPYLPPISPLCYAHCLPYLSFHLPLPSSFPHSNLRSLTTLYPHVYHCFMQIQSFHIIQNHVTSPIPLPNQSLSFMLPHPIAAG